MVQKRPLTEKLFRVIYDSNETMSKGDIEEILYSYKCSSIEEALRDLKKINEIKIINKGRYTKYYRNDKPNTITLKAIK